MKVEIKPVVNIEGYKTMFTEEGKEVAVIKMLEGNEAIVSDIMHYSESDTGYEEYFVSENKRVCKVYDKQLEYKEDKDLKERISKLKEEYISLYEKISIMRKEKEEYEKNKLKLKNEFAKYAGIENLLAFFDGKITHYVIFDCGSVNILTFEETFNKDNCDNEKRCRMLQLFGDSDKKASWYLTKYYDGSGYAQNCIPCLSYEHAVEEMQKIIDSYSSYSDHTIKTCEKHGIKLKEEILLKQKSESIEQIKRNLFSYEEKIQEQKKLLQQYL